MAERSLQLLSGRRERISVSLTAVATVLWAHSILYAKFEIGHLGLIHGLPVTFFIALAFLTVASAILWLSPQKHGKLLCLQLLIFISALWLVPLITGGSPPFTDHAYRNLGMIDYVVRQNHFDPTQLFYQSWPGSFIVSAVVVKIGAVNLEPWLNVFPFFTQLFCLFPLYLFLRNTLGEARSNYCWAGIWLFFLANWSAQGYLGPPAIALFLLLTLLALITSASIRKDDFEASVLLCLVVLVFITLAVTHLLTALAALCILGALYLVTRKKRMALVVGICLLFVVGWDLSGAQGYILKRALPGAMSTVSETPGEVTQPPGEVTQPPGEVTQPHPVGATLDPRIDGPLNPKGGITFSPGVIAEREITGHYGGSESHVAVTITRLPFSAIFALLGLLGVISTYLFKRNFSTATPVLVIALAPLLLLPLSTHYAGEFAQRLYLFALAPMAFFAVSLFDVRRRTAASIFCLLLIIGTPLHVIAHYGNEAMDYFSPGHVAGLHFFHDNTSRGYVTGGYLGRMENAEKYQFLDYNQFVSQDGGLLTEEESGHDLPHYIALSRHDLEYYRFYLGVPDFFEDIVLVVNQSVEYNLVYCTMDIKIYTSENFGVPDRHG